MIIIANNNISNYKYNNKSRNEQIINQNDNNIEIINEKQLLQIILQIITLNMLKHHQYQYHQYVIHIKVEIVNYI